MTLSLNAGKMVPKDIIEVPIHPCRVVKVEKIGDQFRNSGDSLMKITVVPTSGPWANCEGQFTCLASDAYVLVKKYSTKEARRDNRRLFFKNLFEKIFGPKVEEVKQLPPPVKPVRSMNVRPYT